MVFVKICPLCGCNISDIFDHTIKHGYELTYRICKKCGLVFLSPRLDEEAIKEFYATEYRKLYQGSIKPTQVALEIEEQRAKHITQITQLKIAESVKSHLDIGSSTGRLLKAISSEFECYSIGIEPNDAYREFAREEGLKVYTSIESLVASSLSQFDLVTMSHVLEHLVDPVGYLVFIRQRILRQSGYLLVEVPNLFSHPSFSLAHNFAFSPDTLRETIQKAGFSLTVIKLHGIPRTTKPWYITVLAQARPDWTDQQMSYRVKSNARFVHLHREMGLSDKTLTRFLFKKTHNLLRKKLRR